MNAKGAGKMVLSSSFNIKAGKILFVLLASQIVFWAALFVIETLTLPKNYNPVKEAALYLSDESSEFDLTQPPIHVPYENEPDYYYRDPSHAPRGMFLLKSGYRSRQR